MNTDAAKIVFQMTQQFLGWIKSELKEQVSDPHHGWISRDLFKGRGEGFLGMECLELLRDLQNDYFIDEEVKALRNRLAQTEEFSDWNSELQWPLGRVIRDLALVPLDLAVDCILRTGGVESALDAFDIAYTFFEHRLRGLTTTVTAFARVESLRPWGVGELVLGPVTAKRLTSYEVNRLGMARLSFHLRHFPEHEIRNVYLTYPYEIPRSVGPDFDVDTTFRRIQVDLMIVLMAFAIASDSEITLRTMQFLGEFPFERKSPLYYFAPFPRAELRVVDPPTGFQEGAVKVAQQLGQLSETQPVRMRTCVRRYLIAAGANEPTDSLVDYAIALEALVTHEEDPWHGVSARFSNRLANLIATGSEERFEIRSQAEEVYRARSSIVHGSEPETDSTNWTRHQRMAGQAAHLVRRGLEKIAELTEHRTDSWPEFWSALEERRF